MVKMGDVWDRGMEVLNGRGNMLAGIAAVTLFAPAVVAAAWSAYGAPTGPGAVTMIITLLTTLAGLWGQLFVIAAASDPQTGRAAARRQANARFAPALMIVLVLGAVMLVALLPTVVLLSAAGFDLAAMAQGAKQAPTSPGLGLLAVLYALIVFVVLLFVGGRMLPLYAVVLHERRGLAAVARSWRLTRRHTWRLFGVVVLFLIVLMIATGAAQSVSGLIVRIALGAESRATVTFLAAVVAQAVSTALTVIAIVFSAQLYVAFTARERLSREPVALHEPEVA